MFNLTGNPELDKDLVEERQREILEEAEADRIAAGKIAEPEDFQPATDTENDLVDTREENRHIPKD